jgi:Na+-translocating ferredoxin:NAD+ oxidoreductase subunit D
MKSAVPLNLGPAPHVHSGASVPQIMRHVVVALLPASGFAVWLFGLAALLTMATAVSVCIASERLLQRAGPPASRPAPLSDGSAAVTGLIFGLILPPSLPLWMVALGAFISIAVGKRLFGGLGANPFNPALVGRVFLQAAFPAAMTTWLVPLAPGRFTTVPNTLLAWPFSKSSASGIEALTGATPLGAWKFSGTETAIGDLAIGVTGGSTGETSALLLLLGGLYLVAVRAANWRIPVALLVTVALAGTLLHVADPARYGNASFLLLSGGLMIGAWFMATDPVASPVSRAGAWIYGIVIGLLVVAIRAWSGQPEGVMYAILLGNAVSPHIDRWVQPRVYGHGRHTT